MKMVIENRHTRRQYVYGRCKLVKTACTHSLCRHVMDVVCSSVWSLCVCKNVHMQVCALHTLRTHLMHHTLHPVPAETGYWRDMVKWTGGS